MDQSSQSSSAYTTATPATEILGEEPLRVAMDKRGDLALALGFVLLGGYICYLASSFRVGVFPDPVTPRGLPYLTGGFMIVSGLFLAIRRVLTWSALPGVLVVSEGTDDEPGHPASGLRAAAIIALVFLWVWLLRPAGYLLISPPILAAMLWLMGVRSRITLVAFPFGFSLIVWIIFSLLLKIVIPLGPLTPLARSWGLVP